KAEEVTLDLSWTALVLGRLELTKLAVDGAQIRILRRADGSLELADLLARPARRPNGSTRKPIVPSRAAIQVRGAAVNVIDELTATRLTLQNVEGEAVRAGYLTVIPRMRGTTNGGPFHFTGQLDRTGDAPEFEGRFRADDVSLDDGMNGLRYLVPVLAGAPVNLRGRATVSVYLRG